MLKVPHSYPFVPAEVKTNLNHLIDDAMLMAQPQIEAEIENSLTLRYGFSCAQTVPSASAGFGMLLSSIKIGAGDEVILPAINCASMWNVATQTGAKVVLCDCRSREDFRPGFEEISREISVNTKLIVITHYFGQCIEAVVVRQIKQQYPHILILEDYSTCPLLKEFSRPVEADFGLLSFGSTKPVAVGSGGCLLSHERIISTQYDVIAPEGLAFNCKLSSLDQLLLHKQLQKADEDNRIRRHLMEFWRRFVPLYGEGETMFRGISFAPVEPLVRQMEANGLLLDIRNSVQLNLAQQLQDQTKVNAVQFANYVSIPINQACYEALLTKALINPIEP